MPILAAETNIFPCDLLERDDLGLRDVTDTWRILHTRARQEKCIARDLLIKMIPFYLPLVRRRLLIRGRPIQSYVPLFPGYVFLYGSSEHWQQALSTNRVANSFSVTDGQRLRAELQCVKQLIESGARLTVESRLEANQRVRVRAGAFEGLEGIVARRKNETRLVVWVQMLQQGVSLEIEDFLLEPID